MIFFIPWKLPVKEYEINLNKHLQDFNMNMVILRRKLYKTSYKDLSRSRKCCGLVLTRRLFLLSVSVLNLRVFMGHKSSVSKVTSVKRSMTEVLQGLFHEMGVWSEAPFSIGCSSAILTDTGTAHGRKWVRSHQTFSGPRRLVRKSQWLYS